MVVGAGSILISARRVRNEVGEEEGCGVDVGFLQFSCSGTVAYYCMAVAGKDLLAGQPVNFDV